MPATFQDFERAVRAADVLSGRADLLTEILTEVDLALAQTDAPTDPVILTRLRRIRRNTRLALGMPA